MPWLLHDVAFECSVHQTSYSRGLSETVVCGIAIEDPYVCYSVNMSPASGLASKSPFSPQVRLRRQRGDPKMQISIHGRSQLVNGSLLNALELWTPQFFRTPCLYRGHTRSGDGDHRQSDDSPPSLRLSDTDTASVMLLQIGWRREWCLLFGHSHVGSIGLQVTRASGCNTCSLL